MVLAELRRKFGEKAAEFVVPEPVSNEDIRLVHTDAYLQRLKQTTTWLQIFEFTDAEYSPERATRPLPELIEDLKLKSGGTLLAARFAVDTGLAANLGGGYHHAFPDRGHGYCVIHDIAIAVRRLQQDGRIKRAMIVDLDFHQGDGSAVIFKDDDTVFTLSMHSQDGWPEQKQESNLDVGIYCGEEHLYVEKLNDALGEALRRFAPDMVVFIAGSDPYEKDVLPGTALLKMSLEQLKKRDELVIDTFADRGIPLVSVFAGGYGPDVWEVHYNCTKHLLERSGILVASTQTH